MDKKKYSEEDKAKIIETYLEGYGLKAVSEKFGLSRSTINKIVSAAGIMRPKYVATRMQNNSISLDVNYFTEINTPDKAYWMGYFIADGTISRDGYKASLCSKDREVIENFKKAVNSGHAISEIKSPDKRTNKIYLRYMLQICSKEFVAGLVKNGVTSNKSLFCNIPDMDDALFLHYCRGIFDGDGCISKEANKTLYRIQFVGTIDILTNIQNRFKRLFDVPPLPIRLISKTFPMYSTNYYKHAEIILENLYKNSNTTNRLNRKYERFREYKKKSQL